jgi:hypothetical protein
MVPRVAHHVTQCELRWALGGLLFLDLRKATVERIVRPPNRQEKQVWCASNLGTFSPPERQW